MQSEPAPQRPEVIEKLVEGMIDAMDQIKGATPQEMLSACMTLTNRVGVVLIHLSELQGPELAELNAKILSDKLIEMGLQFAPIKKYD